MTSHAPMARDTNPSEMEALAPGKYSWSMIAGAATPAATAAYRLSLVLVFISRRRNSAGAAFGYHRPLSPSAVSRLLSARSGRQTNISVPYILLQASLKFSRTCVRGLDLSMMVDGKSRHDADSCRQLRVSRDQPKIFVRRYLEVWGEA